MKKCLILFLLLVPILSFSADITDNINTHNYGLQVSLSNLFMNGNIDLNNKDIVNGGIFYGTATNANLLDGIDSSVLARLDQSNTFAGGATQAVDQFTATNIAMYGNIALGSGYLSGDGGDEGISVDSDGAMTVKWTASGYGTIASTVIDAIIKSYFAANASANPSWNCFRSGGTVTAPAATVLSSAWAINYRTYNGSAFVQSAILNFSTTQTNSAGNTGSSVALWNTPNGGTLGPTLFCDHNRAVRLYNMTTGPTTGSGYGVIAATNNEVYVWDGSGNRTLLSAENEQGEMIRKTDKPAGGFTETVNLSLLGRMMEDVAAGNKVDQYAGRIYSSNSIPVMDWRANEKARVAEQTAALSQWQALPLKDKVETPQPVVKPERPIPVWAVAAQKPFDYKYVEAVK